MPVVHIQQSSGRTVEQRRKLIAGITRAFEDAYGLAPEAVTVFFQDFADESWGKEGLLHADRTAAKGAAMATGGATRSG